MTFAAQLIDIASQKGVMVATAESCTAGMVAAAIADIAGASAVLERGFVTYSNTAKVEMLDVSPSTLEAYGAVSEAVALEMATGARHRSLAQITVSITGIAGPGGSEHKPEGLVCFATDDGRDVKAETVEFGALGRTAVRVAARDHALALLLHACEAYPAP